MILISARESKRNKNKEEGKSEKLYTNNSFLLLFLATTREYLYMDVEKCVLHLGPPCSAVVAQQWFYGSRKPVQGPAARTSSSKGMSSPEVPVGGLTMSK